MNEMTEIKSSAFGASLATVAVIKAAEENTQAARKGGVSALVALINDNHPLWGTVIPQGTKIEHGAAVALAAILKKGGIAQAAAKRLSEQTIQATKYLLTLEPANRPAALRKAAEAAKSTAALMSDLGGKESATAKKAAAAAAEKEGIAASVAADRDREAITRGIFAWGILISPITAYCAWGQSEIIEPRRLAAEKEKAAVQAAAQAAAAQAAAAQAAAAQAALQAAEDDFKAVEAALKAAPTSKALKAAMDAARQAVEASRLAAACPETAAAAAAAASEAEAASSTLEKAAELIPDSLPRLKAAARKGNRKAEAV